MNLVILFTFDVTAAFVAAVEIDSRLNSVINVGSGVPSSIQTVASSLVKAFNADNPLEITSNFRLGDIRHNFADITKLSSLLKIKPAMSLEQGLIKFAQWVNAQPLPSDKLDKANEELISRRLMQ